MPKATALNEGELLERVAAPYQWMCQADKAQAINTFMKADDLARHSHRRQTRCGACCGMMQCWQQRQGPRQPVCIPNTG